MYISIYTYMLLELTESVIFGDFLAKTWRFCGVEKVAQSCKAFLKNG